MFYGERYYQKKQKTSVAERQLLPGWQGCTEKPHFEKDKFQRFQKLSQGTTPYPSQIPPPTPLTPCNPSPPCTRPSFANWNRSCWTVWSFQISPHEASRTETFKMNISKRLLSSLLSDKNLCSQEARFRNILRIASCYPWDSSGPAAFSCKARRVSVLSASSHAPKICGSPKFGQLISLLFQL